MLETQLELELQQEDDLSLNELKFQNGFIGLKGSQRVTKEESFRTLEKYSNAEVLFQSLFYLHCWFMLVQNETDG